MCKPISSANLTLNPYPNPKTDVNNPTTNTKR